MPDKAPHKPDLKRQMAVAVDHHAAGRLDQAEAAYLTILDDFPNQAAVISNLATIVTQKGQTEEALSLFDRALKLDPAFLDAATNKAQLLKGLNRQAEALECYDQALKQNPEAVALYFHKGNLLQELKRFDQALACYDEALARQPDNQGIQVNRGLALQNLKRFEEALRVYDGVLILDPENSLALMNKAVVLTELNRLEEALVLCDQVLASQPENYTVLNNKGYILNFLGRVREAEACFRHLSKANPEDPEDEYSRSLMLLQCGDFKAGWPAHEARLRREKPARRASELSETYGIPKWNGEPLKGKSILIDAEQGLGDSIQFIRYAARLQAQGARTIFVSQTPLVPLFKRAHGIDKLVSRDEEVPGADVYSPLMSLPGILGDDDTNFPATLPYLEADPALEDYWRDKLAALRGLKIGIFWHGNPAYEWNQRRSIPLEAFRPLAEIDGVHLISLQKGPGVEEIKALKPSFELIDFGEELDEKSGAFMDSAAIIKNLDLVIASDSAITHLAGALAAPLWILLSKPADWRWMLDRETSPWYPKARIFRQHRRGDWAGLMERVVTEVKKHAA